MKKKFGERILGPESPVISRVQNWFIKKVLLKVEREASFEKIRNISRDIMVQTLENEKYKALQIIPDVDPV